MDIKQFRQQYPDYNDVSDMDLARKLHAKDYSDMSFEEFAPKFGVQLYGFKPGKEMDLEGNVQRPEPTFGDSALPKARVRDVPGIVGRGLVSAELGVAKGVMGTIDAALNLPSEDVRKVGTPWAPSQFMPTREQQIESTRGIKEAKRKIMSAQEKFTPQHSGALAWTTRTISEAVPYMANAAVAGAAFGPAGAFGVGFAVEGDYAYDDAISSLMKTHKLTRDQVEARPDLLEQAQIERVVVGSLNAIIEALQVGRVLKFAKSGKHSLKSFVKLARKKGMKAAGKELKGWSGEVARLSIEEALEEFGQEGVSLGIPAAFRGEYPTKEDGSPDWLAIGERLGGAALGGAVAGPVLGGAGRVLTGRGTDVTAEQLSLLGEDGVEVSGYTTLGEEGAESPTVDGKPINVYMSLDGETKGIGEADLTRFEDGRQYAEVDGKEIEVRTDPDASGSGIQDAPMSEVPAEATAEIIERPKTPSNLKKSLAELSDNELAKRVQRASPYHKQYAQEIAWREQQKELAAAQPVTETPAAPEQVVGPAAGTPITKQEKDALRKQSHSVIDILNMNPSEARGLLGIKEAPAPTKPPRRSKTTLRAIGHKIARESNVDNNDYRDYAEAVTGKRSMKNMTRKEMEEFVVALEESFGSPTELAQEDFETPITVAGRGTTMGSVYRDTIAAVDKLVPKRAIPDRVKMSYGKSDKLRTLKNFFFGIDNTPVYHLARILDGATNGIFSEVFGSGIQFGTKITDSHKRSTFGALLISFTKKGITNDDLAKMGKAVNPRTQTDQMLRKSAATEILVEKINDREYEMTWANLIDIYLIANQKDGIRHMQEGGLVINNVETGALSDAWILDTMMKVEENEKAKAVVDTFLEIGMGVWAPSLNLVSNRIDGRDIATKRDWWGLEVYMPKKLKGKQQGINLIEDKGILKNRTKSGAPLVVRDAFSRFAVFEDAVAEYVGMAEPTRITRTLLNDPGITKTLKQKGYNDVLNNIRKIHETAQSVHPTEGGLTAFVEQHLPALYRAALHANPPVVVSQATSTFNYGAYVSPEFMANIKDGLSIKLCQETLALSDVAWARFHMGQSSLELGEMAKSDAALRMFTNKSADINKLGWGLKIGDLVGLTGGMSIAQQEYQKALKGDLKGLSAEWWIEKNNLPEVDVDMWRRVTEEGENANPQERQAVEIWKQTVSERAEYLWQRTQPSWDKWNRSVITSQKGIARTFLLFRSFHEKCLTIFNEAKLDYDNSSKSLADKTAYVQKTGSVLASYTVNMTLRLAILAAMTRKIKEPLDYLQDILTSWMGMFPVFGKVLAASVRTFIAALTSTKPAYKGEALESYPVSVFNLALRTPVDFTDAVGHSIGGDNDEAKKSFLRGIDDIFKGVGAICGVPVYQIKRVMPKTGEERTSTPARTLTRRRVTPPVRGRS